MRSRAPEMRGLLRAAEIGAWVCGVIAAGCVLLALVALALAVSERVGFGPWGAVGVFGCAAAAGLFVWRRGAHRPGPVPDGPGTGAVTPSPGRRPSGAASVTVTEVPGDLVAPAPRRTVGGLPAAVGPSRLGYYSAMEAGRPAEARAVVESLRAAGEDPRWCENALRRIEVTRARIER